MNGLLRFDLIVGRGPDVLVLASLKPRCKPGMAFLVEGFFGLFGELAVS
jgi:hypothetical protein